MKCQCGCGQTPKNLASRYMRGHQPKAKVRSKRIEYEILSNGCWLWLGAQTVDGYGQIRRDGRTQKAHRWFYGQKYGEIPKGQVLHHTCKNTRCVNPDHMQVMAPSQHALLENYYVLTPDAVRSIRDLYATNKFTLQWLADRFGVTFGRIHQIVTGNAWKDV